MVQGDRGRAQAELLNKMPLTVGPQSAVETVSLVTTPLLLLLLLLLLVFATRSRTRHPHIPGNITCMDPPVQYS